MSDKSNSGGVTTMGLLGVVFVALKLGGVIDWSWWWVTLPFWFGPAFMLLVLLLSLLIVIAVESRRGR